MTTLNSSQLLLILFSRTKFTHQSQLRLLSNKYLFTSFLPQAIHFHFYHLTQTIFPKIYVIVCPSPHCVTHHITYYIRVTQSYFHLSPFIHYSIHVNKEKSHVTVVVLKFYIISENYFDFLMFLYQIKIA